jgi:hypothetical protein
MQNFMQSPWGQAANAVIPGVVGLYGAKQAQNLGNQVAGTIPAAVQPATSLGAGISTQLQGGPQMPGPYGASINQLTGAASNLGNVAQQYSTGQLTPAQQLALQQGVNAATANKNLAFAMGGNALSSASTAESQNIANQAIIAGQQIQQNNIGLAQSAMQTVTNTYNSLVGNVLNAAGLGGTAAANAARMIMQNNQQIQQSTSQIWQNITKGIIGAATGQGGTSPTGQQTPASNANSPIQQVLNWLKGQNQSGAVNPQQGQPGATPAPGQQQAGTPAATPNLSDMGGAWGNYGDPNAMANMSAAAGTDTSASTDTSSGNGSPG